MSIQCLGLRENQSRFIAQLQEFLRIPSVSSDPQKSLEVKRCAQWLAKHLSSIGLKKVRVLPTKRHPIVYAESRGAPGKPTILIYGHYDVQPADPASDWRVPPFEARIENGFIFGRGASDDKGQLFTHLKALDILLRNSRGLPLNVKCLFEGEEEIGSPNLRAFIQRNRPALKADVAVMSDTRMLSEDQPALTYSLRGQLAVEIVVRGPSHDLHSGNFGGAVHGTLQALCEIISRLHNPNGQIAIPGFYDDLRVWNDSERRYLARTGPSNAQLLRETGAPRSWGERGYSIYERLTLRPSLAVTGLCGGHAGSGPKAVIPSTAKAKLSFRLVPDQKPEQVEALLGDFLKKIAPRTVKSFMRTDIRSDPGVINRRHSAMRAAAIAYEKVFRRPPVWVRSGGSIPVVSEFQTLLGIPTVLMGFASPGDNLHGPNEKFSLKNFHRGILTSIAFMQGFARGNSGRQQARNATSPVLRHEIVRDRPL